MNMTRLNLTIALALTAFFAADAGVVSNLRAGKLSEAGISPDETSLTVIGSMNAADFAYIFDNLSALKVLDIYNVKIEAYNGAPLPYTGVQSSPAATLPDYALTGLTKLEDISLPDGLKAIGKGALSGTGLKSLYVPESVTSIGDYAAMRCSDLQSVSIPGGVSVIGTRAFAYCPKLSTVDISARLKVIPEGLFEACGGLRALSLANLTSCVEIGPWAVAECDGLQSLILPASSQALEKGAAYGVSGLQTLTLPENLNYLADNSMTAMTSLSQLDATKISSVPDLGENVWGRLDQSEITLITPNNLVEDYKNADQWSNFRIIAEDDWENSTETIASTIDGVELKIAVDSDKITISSNRSMGRVAVFNVAGRRIVEASAKYYVEIPVSGWASGIYLVATELGAAKVTI